MNDDYIQIISYLNIMELPLDAPINEDIVNNAYRKLVKIYHPDVANDRYKDGIKFIELKKAREYLLNNITYVNSVIKSGFSKSNSYSTSDYAYEKWKQEQEFQRRKKEEEEKRRREEESRRKTEEERRKREEEQKRKTLEKEKILKEKKDIEIKLKEIISNIDKNLYRDKEYNNIIELINEFLIKLPYLTNYKKEYVLLIEKIKKQRTKNFFDKIKLLKKISIICSSCITVLIIVTLIIKLLIIPHAKYMINLNKYNNAIEYIEVKEYDKAKNLLKDLDTFKNSSKLLDLLPIYEELDKDNYENAIRIISSKYSNIQIQYNVNGGTLSNECFETIGDIVIKEVKKNGYLLDKYVVDNYEINIDENISVNITLKAIYITEKYSVSYIYDGSLLKDNISSYDIESDTFILNYPNKDGYEFVGWYNQYEENIDKIQNGSIGDLILKAKYVPISYDIMYNLDGGTTNSNNPSNYNIESETITLEYPTKLGYTFIGWNMNGSSEIIKDLLINKGSIGNINLTANWVPNEYKIIYILNGGINNINNPTGYVKDNGDTIIYEPSKEGYTFIGWTSYSDSTPKKELYIENGTQGHLTFIANYIPNEYKIKFDVNGGSNLISDELTVSFDSNYKLITPNRIGYEFIGWKYENNDFNYEGKYTITSDIVLVASWQPIVFNINYSLNGGVNNILNPNNYTIEEEIILYNPSKIGYTFIGWTSDIDEKPTYDYKILLGSYGDITIVANYTANTYKITYDVNTGDKLLCDIQEVLYDSNFNLAVPTKVGYSFDGWYLNDEKFEISKWNLLENIELKAKWTANVYQIEIIDENIGIFDVTYDSNYTLNNHLKDNYIFKGYYSEPYGKGTKYTDELGYSLNIFTDIANIKLYPYYQYKIDFVSNGGVFIESLTLDENINLSPNITTTKEERTFGGWYIDIDLITPLTKVIGNVTVYAKWEEETPTSLFKYEFSDNVKIFEYNGSVENIVIPSHVGGKIVSELASSLFGNNESVKKIVIPFGITKIPMEMCYGCINLEEFIFNNLISDIEYGAFYKCINLKSIEIPSSVENIGSSILTGCNNLEKLTLPFIGKCRSDSSYETGNLKYLFKSHDSSYPANLMEINITDALVIPDYAFKNLSSIKKICLSENITSIGSEAFLGCINLIEINIPYSVKRISKYAFCNCTGLEEIKISEHISYIDEYAFSGCINLRNVEIQSDKIYMGYGVFSGCELDTLISPYPSVMSSAGSVSNVFGHKYIKEYIINGTAPIEVVELNSLSKVDSIYVSDTIEKISYDAFCFSSLQELSLPNLECIEGDLILNNNIILEIRNLETLSEDTLINAGKNIFKLILPKNLTYIENDSFNGWTNLQEISLDNEYYKTIDGVLYTADYETIIRYPIAHNLEKYEIHSSTKKINENCFNNCINLKELIISDNVTNVGAYSLNNLISLSKLTIGKSVEELDYKLFQGTYNIDDLIVVDNNYYYDSRNNCNAIVETLTNKVIYGTKNTIIPDSIEVIGQYAFYNNTNLKNIVIPQNVVTIEKYAFWMCSSLENVYLENGVESIMYFAFADCKSLRSIFIPNSVIYMENNVFYRPNEYLTIKCEVSSVPNTWDLYWNWGGHLTGPNQYIVTYYGQNR